MNQVLKVVPLEEMLHDVRPLHGANPIEHHGRSKHAPILGRALRDYQYPEVAPPLFDPPLVGGSKMSPVVGKEKPPVGRRPIKLAVVRLSRLTNLYRVYQVETTNAQGVKDWAVNAFVSIDGWRGH